MGNSFWDHHGTLTSRPIVSYTPLRPGTNHILLHYASFELKTEIQNSYLFEFRKDKSNKI